MSEKILAHPYNWQQIILSVLWLASLLTRPNFKIVSISIDREIDRLQLQSMGVAIDALIPNEYLVHKRR